MRRVARVAAVVASVAAAAPLGAQMIPDIKTPIDKAHKAADATNRNLSEQTGQALPAKPGTKAPAPQAGKPSGPAAGSVSVPPPAPGTTAAQRSTAAPGAMAPVTREIFSYSADGRRDPFFSLILTEDLRPLLSDLKLVGILYSTSGSRSVAIMRDVLTNAQYRVNPGMTLGRMRVAQIKPRAVIFTVEEFGMSRQDSLFLVDSTRVRIK
ncbi:MAG: hypothetical protein JWM95_3437 [Gemmatimonadetes bacterium]|nr:hypothetical protein [Gemmatimonadota bacterium]